MSTGAESITAERQRQITEEGYTPEHDQHHEVWDFISTAIEYAGGRAGGPASFPVKHDPSVHPTEYARRDLVKAGALIAAAIDRLDAEEGER